jgi:hypothetical protein
VIAGGAVWIAVQQYNLADGEMKGLQAYAVVHLVEGEANSQALEFNQVALVIVLFFPEAALAPVNFDGLILAADEYILLYS